jgi:hypothetical protein
MFEIVKRQHIRPAGHLVPRTSHGPQPWAPDMLGKQNMSSAERLKTGLSFISCLPSAEGADIDHESNQVS